MTLARGVETDRQAAGRGGDLSGLGERRGLGRFERSQKRQRISLRDLIRR